MPIEDMTLEEMSNIIKGESIPRQRLVLKNPERFVEHMVNEDYASAITCFVVEFDE